MTFAEARKRILTTIAQAATAVVLTLLGALTAGAITAPFVIATLVSGFGVPVVTAAQRLIQAYSDESTIDAVEEVEEDLGVNLDAEDYRGE